MPSTFACPPTRARILSTSSMKTIPSANVLDQPPRIDPVAQLLARPLEQAHQKAATGIGPIGALSEDAGMHPDERRTLLEIRPPRQVVLHRPHQGRLAGTRSTDHQHVADAQTGQFLGQGDRHLANCGVLAHDLFAQRPGDLLGHRYCIRHTRIVPNRDAAPAKSGGAGDRSRQELVGARGFEPPASRSRTVHSTKLSYAP